MDGGRSRRARLWGGVAGGVDPRWVAGAFLVSGTTHLVKPSVFEPMVPRPLPRRRDLVYVSGVAELACGAGLATSRRWAAEPSAALLLAVWPANLQMALDATAQARRHGWPPADVARSALLWVRMPLQITLVRSALKGRRR